MWAGQIQQFRPFIKKSMGNVTKYGVLFKIRVNDLTKFMESQIQTQIKTSKEDSNTVAEQGFTCLELVIIVVIKSNSSNYIYMKSCSLSFKNISHNLT